ncbi:hypothetical protein RP20_CCG023302 [Aedes albopictus]|nr:hypothetical protein RP20_CCG023302 [Aedes albopictus]
MESTESSEGSTAQMKILGDIRLSCRGFPTPHSRHRYNQQQQQGVFVFNKQNRCRFSQKGEVELA